jgi:hypothetical protein
MRTPATRLLWALAALVWAATPLPAQQAHPNLRFGMPAPAAADPAAGQAQGMATDTDAAGPPSRTFGNFRDE